MVRCKQELKSNKDNDTSPLFQIEPTYQKRLSVSNGQVSKKSRRSDVNDSKPSGSKAATTPRSLKKMLIKRPTRDSPYKIVNSSDSESTSTTNGTKPPRSRESRKSLPKNGKPLKGNKRMSYRIESRDESSDDGAVIHKNHKVEERKEVRDPKPSTKKLKPKITLEGRSLRNLNNSKYAELSSTDGDRSLDSDYDNDSLLHTNRTKIVPRSRENRKSLLRRSLPLKSQKHIEAGIDSANDNAGIRKSHKPEERKKTKQQEPTSSTKTLKMKTKPEGLPQRSVNKKHYTEQHPDDSDLSSLGSDSDTDSLLLNVSQLIKSVRRGNQNSSKRSNGSQKVNDNNHGSTPLTPSKECKKNVQNAVFHIDVNVSSDADNSIEFSPDKLIKRRRASANIQGKQLAAQSSPSKQRDMNTVLANDDFDCTSMTSDSIIMSPKKLSKLRASKGNISSNLKDKSSVTFDLLDINEELPSKTASPIKTTSPLKTASPLKRACYNFSSPSKNVAKANNSDDDFILSPQKAPATPQTLLRELKVSLTRDDSFSQSPSPVKRFDSSSAHTPTRSKQKTLTSETLSKDKVSKDLFCEKSPLKSPLHMKKAEGTSSQTPIRSRRNLSVVEKKKIELDLSRSLFREEMSPTLTPPKKVTDGTHRNSARVRSENTPTSRDVLQKTPKSVRITSPHTPARSRTESKSVRVNLLTPSMPDRERNVATPSTPLEAARARLHVSAVPKTLLCREANFQKIFSFLEGRILDKCGGCMYISGVPGTGKTATVRHVISKLQEQVTAKQLDAFVFVEVNGMRLTTPHQAYVQILQALTGQKATWEQAMKTLEAKFTRSKQKQTTVVLVDEMDLICNKRQDVIYNLLEWPRNTGSRLIVITIANTMDLPEKLLSARVTSRMGLNRIYFKPYLYAELEQIVTSRLSGINAFEFDAVRLVAKKVASLSGDCRRALDICRRATEVAEGEAEDDSPVMVAMSHVQRVIEEMMSSYIVKAIGGCSRMERLFLQALATTLDAGVEQAEFRVVYPNMQAFCTLEGLKMPSVSELLGFCIKLSALGIIIRQHTRNDIQQKILLNCSSDDIHWALTNNQ